MWTHNLTVETCFICGIKGVGLSEFGTWDDREQDDLRICVELAGGNELVICGKQRIVLHEKSIEIESWTDDED